MKSFAIVDTPYYRAIFSSRNFPDTMFSGLQNTAFASHEAFLLTLGSFPEDSRQDATLRIFYTLVKCKVTRVCEDPHVSESICNVRERTSAFSLKKSHGAAASPSLSLSCVLLSNASGPEIIPSRYYRRGTLEHRASHIRWSLFMTNHKSSRVQLRADATRD